jgi:hypothetical protein
MKAQYSMSALGLGRVKTALKGVGFGHSDASVAGEQSLARQHQRRVLGKPTWRCLIRLSLSSAWLAPQSWEPQQRPHPWHRCAGGGAVHSIKLGPRAMSDRRPFVPNSRHATPRRFCARAEPRRADRIFQSSGSRQRHGFSGRAPTTTIVLGAPTALVSAAVLGLAATLVPPWASG